ncbi:glycosyltransferase family 2 protein [Agrobacterium sp. rho-13.3]|uniref:glycosyltransferase family 2 protein n=1 Tax=Agrobacterium sp. rho-13.3 TaxID=3072980 RepID=UPI002A0B9877|nr:glycosyltransferase family 2 protein [Agrobacterium sp. rho-13.3]MDX8308068.1 glycosyltransferase family 2 protein [Agrobacterium sp. rho-13.3]
MALKPKPDNSGVDVVFVCRNDIHLINSFLLHYRALGATRFIAVDDASTDGTRELLLEQPDVDVWVSPVRYSEARRGRQWREQLFEIYGKNRWYVNVDSDEFLVFADSETRTISDLIKVLEAAGDKRLAAPMLDMYSGLGPKELAPQDPPWLVSDHLDTQGYDMAIEKRGISIKGGPRGRKFGEDNELMKYPVIYWDNSCYFGSSPHRPLPYGRNFPKIWGALLHFKFFVDYKEKIAEAVREKQHFGGSAHYVKLLEEIHNKGSIDLYDETVSVKFTGSQQLVDLGFMTPISWDKLK